MEFTPEFNTYNNISYRQRAKTFQPEHVSNLHYRSEHAPPDKDYLLVKYFEKLREMREQQEERANYANVPIDLENPISVQNHHQSRRSHHFRSPHQNLHSRSHSHHYSHTMPHHQPPVNDPNNYCNISNLGIPVRSRYSHINEPPPPVHNRGKLDIIAVMHVCNELGNNIDSAPPMPSSRKYSIANTNQGLFKMAFPQMRTMKKDFVDPTTCTQIKAGESIRVMGPAKEDRGKFSILHKDRYISLPHQLTQAQSWLN